jgi:hypothetical protein
VQRVEEGDAILAAHNAIGVGRKNLNMGGVRRFAGIALRITMLPF